MSILENIFYFRFCIKQNEVIGYKSKFLLIFITNHYLCHQLCLPHGLQFRTQKHSLEPKFHSFVITRQDGKRYYGASYVFFEEVRNRKIANAMQMLQVWINYVFIILDYIIINKLLYVSLIIETIFINKH